MEYNILIDILIAAIMAAFGSCLSAAFLCQMCIDYKKVNKDKLEK